MNQAFALSSPALAGGHRRDDRLVAVWLLAVAAMIFAMVVIGGITRLTESGLSITEWKPVSGVIPPLDAAAWQQEFDHYKLIPEFQKLRPDMTLAEFKAIFWWEYAHRLWGRLIGIAFALPGLWLLWRGRIRPELRPRLAALFILGGLQGALGWFMVESGLSQRTDVSQYRLVAHLLFALLIYGFMLWTAFGLLRPQPPSLPGAAGLRRHVLVLLILIIGMLTTGGFTAGLDGGKIYNSFPLMGGSLVPGDILAQAPLWSNPFENPVTAQFIHRWLAMIVAATVLALWLRRGRLPAAARLPLDLVAGMTAIQVCLGISTLLLVVPIPLAAAHQAGAVMLLSLTLFALHSLRGGPVTDPMTDPGTDLATDPGTHAAASPVERLPVSVLTGFLGSGKTTLLRELLRHPDFSETAVVINEFGEIGLDHLLVESAREDMVLLASGCLCCTISGDLVTSLRRLYQRRAAKEAPLFRRVVVETTGLADPAPILHTLMQDPMLAQVYRLDGVIATVDAVNGMDQLDRQIESVKQAAVADRLVLTKCDLAPDTKVLEERLRGLNPAAPILKALAGKIDPHGLFDAGLYNPASKSLDVRRWLKEEAYAAAADDHHDHKGRPDHEGGHGNGQAAPDRNRHDEHIRAFCLTRTTPLDWDKFADWVEMMISLHGANLLRIKGVLNVAEAAGPIAIHGVQHLFHPPVELPAWPDADRRSRLVFITRDIDGDTMSRSLAAFLGEDSKPA